MENLMEEQLGMLNLPINLGLNDGTICAASCIEVMQNHRERTSLRHYTDSDNSPLLEAICELDGVKKENIYLAHGSGRLLKQCIPYLIKQKILSSPVRIAKHLLTKRAFPVITGRLTYFKVPIKASNQGIAIHLLPLGPETDWKLRADDVAETLRKRPGLVYICNPNNPTGQLMLERDEIIGLVKQFPDSLFWVDEAYVQYIPKTEHRPLSDQVPSFHNLFVSRTFSFAYGLAGVRMGYLLGPEPETTVFKSQVPDYCFGTLQEQLAIAALTDTEHLTDLAEMTSKDREQVGTVLSEQGIEVVPSKTHYILARFTDGKRTGPWLAEKLLEQGIKIKTFKDIGKENYDEYFRITLGVGEENSYLCEKLKAVLG
jgi:histidinol-phosphate aminotransferase